MGQKKKEHRKKIKARNERIKQERNRVEKIYSEMYKKVMMERIKEISAKTSGDTQNEEQKTI
jgi:hypothetical protein